MKMRLLSYITVCITTLLTLWIFLDFQEKRKIVDSFHNISTTAPLSMRIFFISPEQLGVQTWNLGDLAVYELQSNLSRKRVSFHVATSSEDTHEKASWLKLGGLFRLNAAQVDVWRLLSRKSIRPGSESAGFFLAKRGIPFPIQQRPLPAHPVILEKIRTEKVNTGIGSFDCQHYFAYLQAPDGTRAPLLELWTNSSVRPLGIVRARWRDEVFEVMELQTQQVVNIPEMLSKSLKSELPQESGGMAAQQTQIPPEYQTNITSTTPASVCVQCHDNPKIGGQYIRLESLTAVSGVELDLTTSLYHIYAAELIPPNNDLALISISERGKGLNRQAIRFTWEKGSFYVKTDRSNRLVITLDQTASQGKIRAATPRGRLVLDTSSKPM